MRKRDRIQVSKNLESKCQKWLLLYVFRYKGSEQKPIGSHTHTELNKRILALEPRIFYVVKEKAVHICRNNILNVGNTDIYRKGQNSK